MSQVDVEGFTDLAMGPQVQQPAAMQQPMNMAQFPHQDQTMGAEFFLHPVEDAQKSAELGRQYFEDKEYIRIIQPGNKSAVVERPVRFGEHPKCDNQRFAYQYAMFKQNASQAMSGTPLSEWPGVTPSQIKNLNLGNIHTVEQLANAADNQLQAMLGGLALKQRANDWLKSATDGSAVTQLRAELADKDNQIATQQTAIDELMVRVKELEADKPKNNRRKASD